MFDEFDLELAAERAFWAADAGLVGWTMGGPVGAGVGIALGAGIPYLTSYWDDEPSVQTAIPATESFVLKAFDQLERGNEAAGLNLTIEQIAEAKRAITEIMWNYSAQIGSFAGYSMGNGADFATLFARAGEKLSAMGGAYSDFFKKLYESASESARELTAIEQWSKPEEAAATGLWPKKPKPPAPTPPPELPKAPAPWGLYIVAALMIGLIALVIMKMRKKPTRRRRRIR